MTATSHTPPKKDFSAVMLKIASPEKILEWSHGEVTKPETINYRTQRPELDGLFCERIFGPTKNWECYCGKYKRIRYKGVVCEKCGVEVTRAVVRRERMGHISLAVPVAHTWFLRSTPSRIGLLLDLSVKLLEQIVYFASYIVMSVHDEEKKTAYEELESQFKSYKVKLQEEYKTGENNLKVEIRDGLKKQKDLDEFEAQTAEKIEELRDAHEKARVEIERIQVGMVLTEVEYRNLSMKFGHVFRAGTGSESIRVMLEEIDLDKEVAKLEEEKESSSGQKQTKAMRNVRFLSSLKRAGIRPEWMILKELPVIPPDIRPMVQLDGGRFAASDLNDLYRRIINRNNRLKRLMTIGAPEVICRNEKRMLQEAIDTLINNSPRAGRAVFSTDRRKLRSLSDMLKGKQGRFRQNLLGKRVDYSGRSVIVVGPQLRLHQCGLPKEMALKLFKPFIIGKLIQREYSHNVKGAEKIIQAGEKVVWDILEEVIHDKYVLLNRAPTLHRLGIQAFAPVLIEGKAIQVHPLVCAAFNADFDGDQMAVHLPLSEKAQKEAKTVMLSARNLLKPSSGDPIITPTQDIILGVYFLTQVHDGKPGEGSVFHDEKEAIYALQTGNVDVQAKIMVPVNGQIIETSVGRLIFNEILPPELGYQNSTFRKKQVEALIFRVFSEIGVEATANTADAIKKLGFEYATRSGISIGAADMLIPDERDGVLEKSTAQVSKISDFFARGVITANERYSHSIKVWAAAKNELTGVMIKNFERYPENDIYYMIDSGARGNWGQITQLCGMKGLVANPGGRTIELPIKSNLKDGFSILEYFIATHGGRKGKSDTALKTAEAGYLTRRLVDSVQDVVVRENDCGNLTPYFITRKGSEALGVEFADRIFGRRLVESVANPTTGEIIATAGEEIDLPIATLIHEAGVAEVAVRSVLDCKSERGVCQLCYGRDLGNNAEVKVGTPVGIIAAQSIGEPGTQLTMRTFHMGGVADAADITQGLARVEELFEARTPKTPAVLADIAGRVHFEHHDDEVIVHLKAEELGEDFYLVDSSDKVMVKEGEEVTEGRILMKGLSTVRAKYAGVAAVVNEREVIIRHLEKATAVYTFTGRENFLVEDGQLVKSGAPLTLGHFDLRELLKRTDFLTVQRYITSEVQTIYASQGQTIHDKHIEVIVREMFSRVRIIHSRDFPEFLVGEMVNYHSVLKAVSAHPSQNPPVYERLLLGLTRVALATESWLSAASFQETIRVLVDAATVGKVDPLDGLKENVIIGKLIPAGAMCKEAIELAAK
ncbi:MAG: DNA-directed RNA polymerase subunit beta' [Candidatus Peregrinibacteria bacterium]